MPDAAWSELRQILRRRALLVEAHGLLEWDARVMMPRKAAARRGEQGALLAELLHEQLTDPRVGDLLAAIEAEPTDDPARSGGMKNLRRDYDRAVKVPSSLVAELERARAEGHATWAEARERSVFSAFAPALARLVDLSRSYASCLAPAGALYDALLEGYEPGATSAELDALFSRLESALRPMLASRAAPEQRFGLPVDAQRRLCEALLPHLGFDLEAGRLDVSLHPATFGLGCRDVRLTTRFDPANFLSSLYATLHEGGHGLYEQGLPPELDDTGAGGAASLGLHESQSRLWENFIGGSLPFLRWLVGFGRGLGVEMPPAEALYRARNRVEPGHVRVEADEVSYNLHILLRYRLETALLSGDLPIAELPAAWDDGAQALLGLRPPSARLGVLQDVHWAEGIFGYFPTYTLGNLYAAGIGATLEASLPDLWEHVERGDFAPVLSWLRTHLHTRGHLADTPALLRAAVGDRDLVADFSHHLLSRHGALHAI